MSRPGRTPVTFTSMRTAISRRMVESKSKAPHFYVSTEIEMEAVTAANDALNAQQPAEARVTLTAWLVRAIAQSLAAYPALNAVWNGETLEQVDAINIGIAVANVINFLNPQYIVLGGGVLDALQDDMMPIIVATARDYAMTGTDKGIEIIASRLGDEAGITGSAVLARQGLKT